MRVAFLTHNACSGDAVGNQLAEKVRFFRDRSADVRVFLESDLRLHPHVAPVARRVDGAKPDATAWRYLAECDLIFVEYTQYFPLIDLLPQLAETRARVVVDYHGVTPPRWRTGHNREAMELGVRRRGLIGCADALLAHSQFARAEMLRATRFPAERCHRLGYVVDAEQFRPGESARRSIGPADATRLLFVGRLAANKRVPVLVEALARMRGRRPEVHALVAGDTGDLYQEEYQRCLHRAEELGVADRLHFLGRVPDEALPDLFHGADVFVMPSLHEGFCLPVVEAMACGVPVVAARATALPETVADAGLTFEPDDADDLARQIGRILDASPSPRLESKAFRVAVVAFRYGEGFAGGAEASLRTIAAALHDAGHRVTVWTTCNRAESVWANHLPEGEEKIDGIQVRRFRIDPHDRERHLATLEAVNRQSPLSQEQEQDYLAHSIHSTALLKDLQTSDRSEGAFDAVIVGPYLFGLTHDVVCAFGGRAFLLPCFHDEPLARFRAWRKTYAETGGLLYHSPEEQAFGETELGLNHPGAVQLGTWIDPEELGHAEAARQTAGAERYVIYCGRYSAQKEVPGLIDFTRRYTAERPGRFKFVFIGQGEVAIPTGECFRDLGLVTRTIKRGMLAGAAALVQLSRRESLSLVVLEAWCQGTPVLVNAGCPVLTGQLERGQGGRAVADYEAFAAALDDLWDRPDHWQQLGKKGQQFVRSRYGDRARFQATLESAIREAALPLRSRMVQRGRERARQFDRPAWRAQFARAVEQILDSEKRSRRDEVVITPRYPDRTARPGAPLLVPVRVHNHGTHPLACAGPARTELRCRVYAADGEEVTRSVKPVSLPGTILPGDALPASIPVPVPDLPGKYRVTMWAERADRPGEAADGMLELTVTAAGENAREDDFLGALRADLAEVERLQELPADYLDVTEGILAGWKRLAKRKLLNNFKKAYVDVLSRQQSACNRHLLRTLHELTEYVATLEHALGSLAERLSALENRPHKKRRQTARVRQQGD